VLEVDKLDKKEAKIGVENCDSGGAR